MERIPALKWNKHENYTIASISYTMQLKGVDKEGRNYFYSGVIEQQNAYSMKGKVSTVYNATYKLYTDGTDFKLRPIEDSKAGFKTVAEAKKWVEQAFRTQWTKDHK